MTELEERARARVWNFAANLVKILQRHFNCLTRHTGEAVWAERSAMSGLSVLKKRAECRLMRIPGLDDILHQRWLCRQSSCCDSWKSSFNCPRSFWRSGHRYRILPSIFYWITSDASRQCKIRTTFVDYQKENRVEISQEMLVNANGNENFLRNTITGD